MGRPDAFLTLPERVKNKVITTISGCWYWVGAKIGEYGALRYNKKQWLAHRFVYTKLVGRIPRNLDLDHLCRKPNCVNPRHLEPVTRQENLRRGIGAAVTRSRHASIAHCPAGHPYSGNNVTIKPNGRRRCKACARDYARRRRAS